MNEGARARVRGVVRREQMLDERRPGAGLLLLEPSDAVVVCGETRDDVAIAVAVHVVSEHLRAPGTERSRQFAPDRSSGERRGLNPDASGFEDVGPTVTVDVSDAEAVGERAERARR